MASTREELEARIRERPDDHEAHLVLADLLQSEGDALGQLITLQHEGAAAGFLEAHPALWGEVGAEREHLGWQRWRWGFLRAVTLTHEFDRPLEDVLAALLDAPVGRFLEELTVGLASRDSENFYGGVCELIGARSTALRSLFLGDFSSDESELNWSHLGNAEPLWRGAPYLERLVLRSGSMSLGAIVAPALRSFTTITGGLDADAVRSIASAQWPKLETLSLQFGRPDYGATDDLSLVRPILDARGLPGLKHLGLTNAQFTDALCRELVASRVLPQLESLDLSMGTMGEEGARVLLDNAARFGHLERLVIEDNYVPLELFPEMKERFPMTFVFGEQRDDGGDPANRYASAVE